MMSISTIIRNRTPAFAGILLVVLAVSANAADLNIVGPPGSDAFGRHVVVLPNGNIVVTDNSGPVANIGAVYMYSPNGTLISTLTGGSSGSFVGSGGIQVLTNGNFLVKSPQWRNPTTSAAGAGAVTWVNAATGLSGVVTEFNSLVGTSADDQVGADDVIALANGNYVVAAYGWDNGSALDAGAVVWGNGATGISGPINVSKALLGIHSNDQVGRDVVALSNGNYVIGSRDWSNGAVSSVGAATWANGSTGIVGLVTSTNSLIGTSADDSISSHGITALSNGNYVVASAKWRNGTIDRAGAATWANGSSGRIGVVSSANSLVGSTEGDRVGESILALTNGNYVVRSSDWANGTNPRAGAATWGNGSSGVKGAVSVSNSLVGTRINDGSRPADAGNVSLVALSNGNYVVLNSGWDNGAIADVGAATWGNGTSGRSGVISASNSLIGSTAGDAVGSYPALALTNGNYVVGSDLWQNGSAAKAGAATWCNGASGRVGVVSASNSLVGSSTDDRVSGHLFALDNGNYVVASRRWDNGAIENVGAVTLGNGISGTAGTISSSNSLIGGITGDAYGTLLLPLANGDFIAGSGYWDSGVVVNAGAFTRVDGRVGLVGVPSSVNSIRGSIFDDSVGLGSSTTLGANNYAIRSAVWDNGGIVNAGAVTILHNSARTRGLLSTANSVLGTAPQSGFSLKVTYDPVLDRAVIGRPDDNMVTVRALSLFADSFE